jgi:HSP20 family molecular chaperone IbpA
LNQQQCSPAWGAITGRRATAAAAEHFREEEIMNKRPYVDIGSIFDDIFEAAKDFGERVKNFAPDFNGPRSGDEHEGDQDRHGCHGMGGGAWFEAHGDDNVDYYPNYSYPPLNVYMLADKSLVFEFALAGFDEKNMNLSFQGDYMVFSARIDVEQPEEGVRYFKRRLKLKDIDKQKYYVPADKFDQEKVKAAFRNGILKVTVPPKDVVDTPEGIKIEIVKEGE